MASLTEKLLAQKKINEEQAAKDSANKAAEIDKAYEEQLEQDRAEVNAKAGMNKGTAEEAEAQNAGKQSTGAQSSVVNVADNANVDNPNAEAVPGREKPTNPALQNVPTLTDEVAVQEVAAQAGATEVPQLKTNKDSPLMGQAATGIATSTNQLVTPILEVRKDQTPEEKMTQRTEVDTHIILVDGEPRGSGGPIDTDGHALTQDPPLGTLPNSNMVYEGDKESIMGIANKSFDDGLALNKVSDEDNEKALKALRGEERRQRMMEGRPTSDDLSLSQEEAERPADSYKAGKVRQFIDSYGKLIKSKDGYFVPDNEDEYNILEYFAKKGLVEAPGKDAEEEKQRLDKEQQEAEKK